MALSTNSVSNTPNGAAPANSSAADNGYLQPHYLGLMEVAGILRAQPESVKLLSNAYAESLSATATGDSPQYTHADLATLINAQRLENEANAAEPKDVNHIYARPTAQETVSTPVEKSASGNAPFENAPGNAPKLDEPIHGEPKLNEQRSDVNNLTGQSVQEPENLAGYVPSRFEEFRPFAAPDGSLDAAPAQNMPPGQDRSLNPNPTQAQGEPLASTQPTSTSVAPGTVPAQDITQVSAQEITPSEPAPIDHPTSRTADAMLGEMLSTVATSQQSVLNVQDSIREMLNVIAQDNFNLKHENRKLRERMLELERVIAEHQRREETRKEMLESRMRAVEGTLSALQQQLAQLVQLQRQRIRKNWFK